MFNQSITVRMGLLLLLIIAVEAFVLLHVLGLGYVKLEHHDHQVYERLAINMMEHSTFSMDHAPPLRPTIFRPPGYPAFIALVYTLFGRSVMAVRVAQFVLLWLTAWLLYMLGTRFVDRHSATVAALLCATYPPFVFMATLYSTTPLLLFLVVLIILAVALLTSQASPRLLYFLLVGLAIGALALVRPGFEVLAAPLSGVILFGKAQPTIKRRIFSATALIIGCGLMIGPWIIRNNLVSEHQSGLRLMVAGWGLYTSALQYRGDISYRMLKPEWDLLIADFNRRNQEAAEAMPDRFSADGKLQNPYAQAQRELWVERSYIHDSLQIFNTLTWRHILPDFVHRVFWLWSTSDVSPWQTGAFHRFVQGYHVVLAALVLWGCYLCRSVIFQHTLLWVVAVYQMLLHLVFHVEARYSLEARLFLLIYAGVGLSYLISRLRQKSVTGQAASLDSATLPRGEVH
ncbi:MAG: glycosyltransferase family 39 protein [Acidobacteriota bacterium]|nr:glycosyltransferase family 39 protein [Blastocatellia bacterium]MDW8240530.1 glycosyltransferase family 39 protein [Acidobacteriota bacterium]